MTMMHLWPGHDLPCKGRILTVLHQERSTPGRVGHWLVRNGYKLDIRRPPLGHSLPDKTDDYAGVIIFGGPMSANDADEFVKTEIDFAEQCMNQGVPFLGICLGAQMLVKALGGTVYGHPEGRAEIGYYPLHATDDGRQLISNWPDRIYQWHREGFDLPTGATSLAKADLFEEQAFQFGPSTFAIQFHTELTLAMMRRWLVHGRARLDMPSAQERKDHLEGRLLYDAPIREWKGRFLQHWLDSDRRAHNSRSENAAA